MNLIYKHTFQTTGKSYIGKTSKTLAERLESHIENATIKNVNTHFYRAIRKYGFDDIISEILEDNIPNNKINEREIFWIAKFNTLENGYNMTKGGDGGNTRIKMNKHELEKYNNKLRTAAQKVEFTEEWKNKISLAKSKNPTKLFGKENGSAKEILILDKDDNIKFKTHGNFKTICIENNLPYSSLSTSKSKNTRIKNGDFAGWCARDIEYFNVK